MVSVNTHEAKSKLSALLARVESEHEEVVICRNGRPVAKLVAYGPASTEPLPQNPRLGPVILHGDPCAPLREEDWPEECR